VTSDSTPLRCACCLSRVARPFDTLIIPLNVKKRCPLGQGRRHRAAESLETPPLPLPAPLNLQCQGILANYVGYFDHKDTFY
jgi:hypothetical protein